MTGVQTCALPISPPLYTREQATLTLDGPDSLNGAEEVTAWVYVYARPERLRAPGARVVPSGDWRDVPDRDQPGADGR